jgi:uncharacterized membrane protein
MNEQRNAVPGGVRVVAILATVIGALQLIFGVLLIALRDDVSGYSSDQALGYGIALLITGAIYLIVALGLTRLKAWALFVGLFFSGLKAVFDIVALIGFGIDGLGFSALVSVAINLCVFWLLWSGREAFGDGAAPARA